MYYTQEKEIEIEGELKTLYGVADNNGLLLYDFTEYAVEAEKVVNLLNENKVERCHIADFIEDMFYSVK